jgi:thiamine transport system permease protein
MWLLMRKKNLAILAVLPMIFLALFYFYPLGKILSVSFFAEGIFQLEAIQDLFTKKYYLKTLWFTFWQASLSTILTLVLALPGAAVFARYQFAGKEFLRACTAVPFVLPTVVVAAAFEAYVGSHGVINTWLNRWFDLEQPLIRLHHTVWIILMAHVFYNYTVVFRIVGGFWAGLRPQMTEAAQMLGASPRQCFFRITLPLLRPVIFTAALLVFVFCFSSFGVILILGGPRFATIEVEIYRQAVNLFNLPMAAALSLLQILFTFAIMWAYTRMQQRASLPLSPKAAHENLRRPGSRGEKIFVWANIGFIVFFLGGPLLALVMRSLLTLEGISLRYYAALFENPSQSIFFVPPVRAILVSSAFALATLLLTLCLGLMAAQYIANAKGRLKSLLDPIFMLPLSTSAVTLGFGFILALDRPPLNLRSSILIVPLAHTLVALPFVIRSILPAIRSIPPTLKESAALLGASPATAWRCIDLPIIGRALLVASVFAVTISLGEFGATAFVARPQLPTMPVAIYRFLGQPGALNYGQAMAMSTILMLVTAAGFLLLEKLRLGGIGEF